MTPSFSISVGGSDITGSLNDRLVSLTVSDSEGLSSDSVEIELDDRDGKIQIPRKGAEMSVSMGYKETGLQLMGLFIVDEVEVSGYPMIMVIRGKSADMREDFKKPRTGYWDDKTLKDVVSEIASRNGLSAKVSKTIEAFKYKYLPQTEESDLHFLTRLARKHDAVLKPNNGKLMFIKKGEGELSGMQIVKTQVIDYNCQLRDRPAVKKGIGTWWDQRAAERKRVEKEGPAEVGPDYEMLHSLFNEDEAGVDAQSTADAQARDAGGLDITILGQPGYCAEMIVTVSGVRQGVDGPWRVKTAEHRLDSGGYITSLTCEYPSASGSGSGSGSGDSAGSQAGGSKEGGGPGGAPGGMGTDSVPAQDLDFRDEAGGGVI